MDDRSAVFELELMMRLNLAMTAFACCASFAAFGGSFVSYGDKSAFLADTGALDQTPVFPASASGSTYDFGSVRVNSGRLIISEWTELLPGNEIAISFGLPDEATGSTVNENIGIVFDSPVFSAGFDFVEDTGLTSINVDSTFEVTLVANDVELGSFQFNAPDDQAYFVGVWSDMAFDTLRVRELVGSNDNEFYGHIYAGDTAYVQPAAIPSPAAIGTGALGLCAVAMRRRR